MNAITNAKILRGVAFEAGELERHIPSQNTWMLYPGPDAEDCEHVDLNEESTVIVIDGTWYEARKVLRRNPFLKTLPKLTFKREIRSQYKIRRQPRDNYLSTLECIGHFLKLSAEATGRAEMLPVYDRLFSVFDKMVEQQFSYFPRMRKGTATGGNTTQS